MAQAMQGGGAAQDPAKAMEAMQKNPEMMKSAAEAMKNMKEEDLQKIAAANGMSGMTPEMAKMAGNMMENMGPDDLAQMQKMATEMQAGGGQPGAGGQPDMAAMAKMMENPAMMKSMSSMMANMTPEMAEKMGMSPDQAEKMSEQMKGMDPATLERLMKFGVKAQSAWQTVKSKRFWMQAFVVLLVAMAIGHLTGTF